MKKRSAEFTVLKCFKSTFAVVSHRAGIFDNGAETVSPRQQQTSRIQRSIFEGIGSIKYV